MTLLKTVPPDAAEGDVKEAYSFFLKTGTPLPKPLELMSVSPGLLKIQNQVLNYYMQHKTLGFALLSTIRYLVAKAFDYQFCTAFNRNFLKMQGLDDDAIEKLAQAPDTAPLDDRDNAMLQFVLKAIRTPDAVEEKDIAALRDMGWTDQDIYDAVSHGTGMIGASYIMKAFKMDTC